MKNLSLRQKMGVHDALWSSALYGLGFIVTKLALDTWSPATVTFMRLFIAALGGMIVLLITKKTSTIKTHLKVSLVPGFVLAAELFIISLGLSATTVSSGVFIANTYVVLVPLFLGLNLFSLKGLHHLFFVALALIGVMMVSGFEKVSLSNYGDFLCLLTSLVTTGHIITVQQAAPKVSSAFAFNISQCIWGSLFLGIGCLAIDNGDSFQNTTPMVWVYMLCAGLVSTLFATMFQVRSQMRIGATASSLLFMMDAPFAAIFGLFLLNESFTGLQFAGAMTILVAALGQFYINWKDTKKLKLAKKNRDVLVNVKDQDKVA